ncbi:PAS domain-containing sensor histidine kinase [Vitiosangium sp. GDMCC 1.1324]|uniref:sensor histidine kinase n=1 Tax=Vitiosangium sp. (strain GDMCC 1.1324) TaxID=2138576 RepID=UPI000D3BB9D7|nr:PAS domain-containing sensor histidine kinase [Vitiosangium sp. GDMCC 1.1324]PTL78914.1 histidine kinase [Vitiosangium sp. GDMCC 1.1324]
MPDAAPHILLVDTPPALQRRLRRALDPLGLDLHWPKARQVIECLASWPLAAVVLPLASAGGVSERQALLLTGRSHARGVPVLLLSEDLQEAVRVMAAHPVGAADSISSPPEPHVLRARMAGLVERFHARTAKEALRQSEERYRLTTLASSDAIYDWDIVTDTLHWNVQVQALFGHPPENIRDNLEWWTQCVHPEDRERALESLGRAIARGDVRWREEYRFARADGSYADVVEQGYIIRDPRGRALRMVGGLQDVTERKRAERNLRFLSEAGAQLGANLELEETLQRLVWMVVPRLADWCGVDVVDEEGQLRRVAMAHPHSETPSLAFELQDSFLGSSSGRSILMRVVETGRPRWGSHFPHTLLVEAARGDSGLLATLKQLNPSSYLLVPLTVRGRALGVLSLLLSGIGRRYDETDVALASELANRAALAVENAMLYQRAQRAISLRDEFLSIAAHELRTPTTSLKLSVQAMLRRLSGEGPLPSREQFRERVENLDQGVARLVALENRLLDVSRLASGSLLLHREQVDLVEVARDVMIAFAQQAENAGCKLVLNEHGPVVGQWDRLRLEQVMANLLTNALKYGAGKPVRVRVLGWPEWAQLSVTDKGIGIAVENLSRIFGRFERAVSGRHYGGLGLGLYITRQIVEALNGEVHVTSHPGQGATFTVLLPYMPVRPQPSSREGWPSVPEEAADEEGRVLSGLAGSVPML